MAKDKDKEKKDRKVKHEKALEKVEKHPYRNGVTEDGTPKFIGYSTMTDQEKKDYLIEVGEYGEPPTPPE